MALFRAIESSRPSSRRLFEDLFARHFLRPSLKLAWAASTVPFIGRAIPGWIDHRWPGARTSGIARTRLIDEFFTAALGRGIAQVVLLGAGFDCRAYRIPHPAKTRFFEVDRAATSLVKRSVLQKRLGVLPKNVAFVEIDFNHQELGSVLADAGFDREQSTFFLWEGVTNYLTASAVESTLRWIGACGPRSELVFTYVERRAIEDPTQFSGTDQLGRTLANVGERWTFGLDTGEVPGYLAGLGLELTEDLGAADYRARYLGHPGVGYEFYRVGCALTNSKNAFAA